MFRLVVDWSSDHSSMNIGDIPSHFSHACLSAQPLMLPYVNFLFIVSKKKAIVVYGSHKLSSLSHGKLRDDLN